MEGYVSEQEQIEAMKKWWRDNGRAVLLGAVVGLGVLMGWRYWQERERVHAETASLVYGEMVAAAERNDMDEVARRADTLIVQFPDTPYGALGALALAKTQVEAGDLGAARGRLEWVLANARQDSLKHAARARLARVRLAQGEPDAALAVLDGPVPTGFAGAFEEVRGDALMAKGDREGARRAYEKAIAAGSAMTDVLRMKLDDAGGPAAKP